MFLHLTIIITPSLYSIADWCWQCDIIAADAASVMALLTDDVSVMALLTDTASVMSLLTDVVSHC